MSAARFIVAAPLLALGFVLPALHPHADARALRVCADPNNMPFANERLQGLENEIAALVARDLHARVEYTWWAQRRGFVRSTLNAQRCDVVMGVPAHMDPLATTKPYYRSSYVFVWREGAQSKLRSLDDPRLRTLRIGVPLAGDDGANPPPVHALARRGIVDNVVGYSVWGDYRRESPPTALLDAVHHGDVDVAIAWGPLAGWYAKTHAGLALGPISEKEDDGLPMQFAIAVGVRKKDRALKDEIDHVLERRAPEIHALLDRYGVPTP